VVTCNVSQEDAPDVVVLVLLAFLIQTKTILRKINVPKGPGNEYPQHNKAKERLGEILKTAGYENISYETQQAEVMLEFLGERRYIADITAEKEGRHYIFEIDGIKNHSTRRNKAKDKARDRAMLVSLGKRTIRVQTWWLVGRGRLSDLDILKEIEWQLKDTVVSVLNV
jgi:hypothetical protein